MAFRKSVNKVKLNEEEQKHVKQCYICNEVFKDPRLLECYHTFCFACIEEYLEANSRGNEFKCPLCKTDTKVPENGASDFERNCFVGDIRESDAEDGKEKICCDVCGEKSKAKSFCYECNQRLCSFCVSFHEKLQATREHNVAGIDESGVRKVKRKRKCVTHDKNELQYFCEDCNLLICIDCNMTQHKLHKCRNIVDVADEFRQQLATEVSKEEYGQHLQTLSNYSNTMKKKQQVNEGKEGELMRAVEQQFEAFQNVLENIKMDFISEISDTGMSNESNEKEGRNSVERKFKSFAALYFFSKLLLQQGDDTAVVAYTVQLRQRLETLSSANGDRKGATSQENVVFEAGTLDMKLVKELFGKLNDPGDDKEDADSPVDEGSEGKPVCVCKFDSPPGDCVVSGIAPTDDGMAWVCMGAEAVVHLFTPNGKCTQTVEFSHSLDDITFMNGRGYVTSNAAKMVRTVDDKGRKSLYTKTDMCVRGITSESGTNRILIGCVANDAFFDVKHDDKSAIFCIKKDGISNMPANSDITYPARMAMDNRGNTIISDWVRQAVVIQNERGKTIAIYKGAQGELNPRGVCVDKDGNIYVVDTETETIQLLNPAGEYQKDLLTKKDGLGGPWAIACDSKQRLWVGSQDGTIMLFDVADIGSVEKGKGAKSSNAESVNSGKNSRGSSKNSNDKSGSATPDQQKGRNGSSNRNKSRSDSDAKGRYESRDGQSRGSSGSNDSRKVRSRSDH